MEASHDKDLSSNSENKGAPDPYAFDIGPPVSVSRGRRPRRGRGRGRRPCWKVSKRGSELKEAISIKEEGDSKQETFDNSQTLLAMGGRAEKKKLEGSSSNVSGTRGVGSTSRRGPRRGFRGGRGIKRKHDTHEENIKAPGRSSSGTETPLQKKLKGSIAGGGSSRGNKRKKGTNLTSEESKLEEIARLLDDTEPGWRDEEFFSEGCEDSPGKNNEEDLFKEKEEVSDEEEPEIDNNDDGLEIVNPPFTQEEIDNGQVRRRRGRLSLMDQLSPKLNRRNDSKSRSLSPAVSKDSPLSESLEESKIKTDDKPGLMASSLLKKSIGKNKASNLDVTPLSPGFKEKTEEKVESNPSAELLFDSSSLIKSVKKKKKHFKGLRYSFGKPKKKPKKKNQSPEVSIEDDSLDSFSQDIPKMHPMHKELDPYDPTDEFDDDQIDKPMSLQQQRSESHRRSKDKSEGNYEEGLEDEDSSQVLEEESVVTPEDEEEEEESEDWNLLLEQAEENDEDITEASNDVIEQEFLEDEEENEAENYEEDFPQREYPEDMQVEENLQFNDDQEFDEDNQENILLSGGDDENEEYNLLGENAEQGIGSIDDKSSCMDDNESPEEDETLIPCEEDEASACRVDEEGEQDYEVLVNDETTKPLFESGENPDLENANSNDLTYETHGEDEHLIKENELGLSEQPTNLEHNPSEEDQNETNAVDDPDDDYDPKDDDNYDNYESKDEEEEDISGSKEEEDISGSKDEEEENISGSKDEEEEDISETKDNYEAKEEGEEENSESKDDNFDPKDEEEGISESKDDEYTYESESTNDFQELKESEENIETDFDSIASEDDVKKKRTKRNRLIMSYASSKRRRTKAQRKAATQDARAAKERYALKQKVKGNKSATGTEIMPANDSIKIKEEVAGTDENRVETPVSSVNSQTDNVRKSKRLSRHGSAAPLAIAAPKLKQEDDVKEEFDFYKYEVADKSIENILCKCRVKENPRAVNLSGDVYCQAIDSFDGRMIGCCNIVTNYKYLRVCGRIPFMLLCGIHRQRMRRHHCCPGCGLFCTQGGFLECRWDKTGALHYFHKLCGLALSNAIVCPHCGTDQPAIEVYLELKLSRKPVVYLKQHQEKKGFLSSARISLTKITEPDATPPDPAIEEGLAVALPSGRHVSPTSFPVGFNRDMLLEAIKAVKAGRSFNIKTAPKAIYWSCKQGDLEKLLFVLAQGLSPNSKVKEYGNQSGLHTAANYGCLEAVHILVMAGASLDLSDAQLMTPLMVALTKGFDEIAKYLIQAGASLHIKTQDGMTALHLAAKAGNFVACKYILDSGRLTRHAINIQDEGGWTPLVWASENRCINVVKILLDCGANPQICDVEQNTALHWAAFSGSTHICSMVLERGCSLRSMNAIGDTPLHIAARQNHVEAVVLLLARGASLEMKNTRGQTPLDCSFPETEVHLQMTLNKNLHNVLEEHGIRSERILSSDIAAGKESVPIPCVNGEDDEGIPKDYVYIAENGEAFNVNIDRTLSSLKWCECEDGCNSENCICSQLNCQCWFDPEGRLLSDFNYKEPPMIFECNRACGCNKLSCNNRVVQHGMTAHLQIFRTSGKGWGVRALKDIPKGSYVCEYVGEIITDLEADQREDDSYLFDLDNRDTETYCIDARQYGNVARFINHLCEPNLTPVRIFIDHQDLAFPRIAFFASRDIEADQELGFDYGEKFWVIKYKQFTCMCGSSACKYSSDTIQTTLENYNRRIAEFQKREQELKQLLVT